MKKIITIAFACLLIGISSAAEKSQDDCADAATQADMDHCVHLQQILIEKELAELIKSFAKRVTPDQMHRFQQAQSAWVQYRKFSCEFNTANSAGGSAHAMALTICMNEKAKARLAELRSLSTCKEGDLDCPF